MSGVNFRGHAFGRRKRVGRAISGPDLELVKCVHMPWMTCLITPATFVFNMAQSHVEALRCVTRGGGGRERGLLGCYATDHIFLKNVRFGM